MEGLKALRIERGTAVGKRPRLPALAAIRLLAALHIYVFHLIQAHHAGLLSFDFLERLPAPILRLLGRGFVSTGLFFQLSGFLLAYAYLDDHGRPKTSDREFWKGRFLRLYPLYFLSLLLLIPAPALLPITAKPTSPAQTLGMAVSNLTLTQAWFPRFAIAWNAPAWALSAFVLFYAVFPDLARITADRSMGWLRSALVATLALAWLPAALYVVVNPEGDAWTVGSISLGGFWLNVLRFNPLVWLPPFVSGVLLGRIHQLRLGGAPITSGEKRKSGLSRGDLAAFAVLLTLLFVPKIPYVLLRHGLLTPLFLLLLSDLASGSGWIARRLSWRGFERLAEAGFGLFALQMPVGVWFAIVTLRSSRGTTGQLFAMIGLTLLASLAWTELIQRPLNARIRVKRARQSPPPHLAMASGLAAPHRGSPSWPWRQSQT